MNSGRRIERSFRGDYRGQDLGDGTWRFSTEAPGGAEIYLTGVDPQAAARVTQSPASRVGLVFGPGGVTVTLATVEGVRELMARSATVHEPLPRLYEALPLASFDARARRFWRRVFLLVRIPGGRRLLGLVARRASAPK
jgi:hypothetical protein